MSLLKEIKILYEDDNIAVINKPAGLIVHPDGKREEESVSSWTLEKYPQTKEVGEPIILSDGRVVLRPGIVHRIDRETSGVLVLAKNQKSFLFLKEQFQNREISKVYEAFVWGRIKEDDGVIDRPIARSRKNFRLWSAQRGGRGELRDALTYFRVLDRKKEFSFVEISPKTGRTHQIRVHFKAINHPLVSDSLYAPKRPEALGFQRLALHAKKLTFKNLEGEDVPVEAPYPSDFEEGIRQFKNLPD